MSGQIDKLLEDTEQHLATILASARKQAAANPSKQNSEAEQSARKALSDYRDSLKPASTEYHAGDWFKNETEALNWLISTGHATSKSQFNRDKLAGMLITDGRRISKFSVSEYGRKLKKEYQYNATATSEEFSARREKAETEKAEHDARISRVKAEDVERELDKKWKYRDEANDELAVIISSLQQAIDHAVMTGAEAVVRICCGDVTRIYDVTETINEGIIARAFNEVAAAGTLRVKFKGEYADAD